MTPAARYRAALVLLLKHASARASSDPAEARAWDEVRWSLGLIRGCQDHDGHTVECARCPTHRTDTCPHGHHGGL
jgi:hypothetical protein